MSNATDANSPDTRLFAKLIAAREMRRETALLGLSPNQLRALFARHFAGEPAPFGGVAAVLGDAAQADFVSALRAMLLSYASATVDLGDAQCLASIIAHACLRPDHLWRDLGLAGRNDVTFMLERYFPALVAGNVANLRWKKFLAQELALSQGREPGPAPGCPGCEDYGHCFPHAS
ncbi:nitrogen fixation protein NifQ [Trinickia violacea]|uniref:Nitrogen fixation protein NifQ n=1 Tax=Trinickia violacea TaxID=2571746 RepID=A0A4P8IL02_9BURK|nr:nitrogen fixation protein NifQ [Trinickia violacea]QCP49562.1 nitrogen fixation protein NifQ [Trinickia violacea]